MSLSRRIWILAAVFAFAFGLRLYRLNAVPLRGDEAFSVRFWAAPPSEFVRDPLDREPHPYGTFLGFWVWKNAAGDSAFAMRYLPLLGNWIGAAATAMLARRFFRNDRAAFLAAFLWAINPFLIWHAQDVRNYALWAGFSPLALWLFLRAADLNRPRDWRLYVLAETLALYTFFFEGLFLAVQGAGLLMMRRTRFVWRRAVFAWAAIGVLLIPWFIQLWLLHGTGYVGRIEPPTLGRLYSWVLPTLVVGKELLFPWSAVFYLAWLILLGLTLSDSTRAPVRRWMLIWIVLPVLLWLAVATQTDIFHPRYVIPITAPLLLIVAGVAAPHQRQGLIRQSIVTAAVLTITLPGLNTLVDYYRGDDPKSGDWPALAAYLESRARPGDRIVQTVPDPAFGYYYRGGADETSLRPDVSASDQLVADLNSYDTIWLIGRSSDAETYLRDHLQEISFHTLRGFPVIQFRRWQPSEDEIDTVADVTFGDIARLRGWTLQGPDLGSRATAVLLYWEPLRQADVDYKVFVHLVGPPNPITGSTLWDQDDHPPVSGFASTLVWNVGSLIRDPYHLLEDPAVTLIPAEYTIRVGLYDPATNARLPVHGSDGTALGDSYPLVTFQWPVK